jgi:hypothetical protein
MTDDVAARTDGTESPSAIPHENKDWTWVLQRPCPDCGFDTTDHPGAKVPAVLHAAVERWSNLLAAPGVEDRPAPDVWSPLEYLCHVRDVCTLTTGRARRMLAEDDPELPSWDQDEAAEQGRYAEQDPALVADELADAADEAGAVFAAVGPDQWVRPGHRSDGTAFTVETLAQYLVHEVEHHLHDVRA